MKKHETIGNDHTYLKSYSKDPVVGYVAGFVARKIFKMTSCTICKMHITAESLNDSDALKLIKIKSKGFLTVPAEPLLNVVMKIEKCVMDVINEQNLNVKFLMQFIGLIMKILNF